MNPRDFVYWLNGYLEISESGPLSARQVDIIKDHLKLVMTKATPSHDPLVEYFKQYPFSPLNGGGSGAPGTQDSQVIC